MHQATAIGIDHSDETISPSVRRRALWACSIGNFFEFFDFVIYGIYAGVLGVNFFPSSDPLTSLLSSFAAYGVGFLMRPVGAAVIGAYGDRRGRKGALVLTIAVMACATGATGLIPSYAAIGIWAPILLVICRLAQGFSAGGEWGGGAAFMVEYAPIGRRGFFGSFMQLAAGLASLAASLSAVLLSRVLEPQDLNDWGWRLPFLLGFVLGPVGYYLRSKINETPAFSQREAAKDLSRTPLREAFATQRRPMIELFLMGAWASVTNYLFIVFVPQYAIQQLGMAAPSVYLAQLCAYVMYATLPPFTGALSDRLGRKPVLLASSLGVLILSYPLMLFVVADRSIFSLVLMQCVIGFLLALLVGPFPAAVCELFPTRVRYAAITSYVLSGMIFGGFAPLTAAFIIRVTGDPVAASYLGIFAAALSTIGIISMKERSRQPLR
jgi:MHS family proline/betaine transporter-like MFS transporter